MYAWPGRCLEGNVSLLESKSEEMHIPDIANSLCDLRQTSRLMLIEQSIVNVILKIKQVLGRSVVNGS